MKLPQYKVRESIRESAYHKVARKEVLRTLRKADAYTREEKEEVLVKHAARLTDYIAVAKKHENEQYFEVELRVTLEALAFVRGQRR